jgi:hypothetical protein
MVENVELFELTSQEESAIKQAFQTVIAAAANAQQEYEQAAEPLTQAAQVKKQKLWAEYQEAAKTFQEGKTDDPCTRHEQAVKPLKDKIHSVAQSFETRIRSLMESIDSLPARLDCGLNGEGIHYEEIQEQELGAMLGPIEIARYNIEERLVPRMSKADWDAQREMQKPSQELSDNRRRAWDEVDSELCKELTPLRQKLNSRLEAAKTDYDKTVQDLVSGAMLRAGLDVTDIRLDRQIGEDDE